MWDNPRGQLPGTGIRREVQLKDPVVPQQVNIDGTGLGGHDLGGFKDFDICIRTDKHGQTICGPSVTPGESAGRDGDLHVTLVALGGPKPMHEVLTLHYMATD